MYFDAKRGKKHGRAMSTSEAKSWAVQTFGCDFQVSATAADTTIRLRQIAWIYFSDANRAEKHGRAMSTSEIRVSQVWSDSKSGTLREKSTSANTAIHGEILGAK